MPEESSGFVFKWVERGVRKQFKTTDLKKLPETITGPIRRFANIANLLGSLVIDKKPYYFDYRHFCDNIISGV